MNPPSLKNRYIVSASPAQILRVAPTAEVLDFDCGCSLVLLSPDDALRIAEIPNVSVEEDVKHDPQRKRKSF